MPQATVDSPAMTKGAALFDDCIDKRGLLQQDVARMLGVHYSYVSQLRHGKRTPGLRLGGKIEDLFGVPVLAWMSKLRGRPRKVDGVTALNTPIYSQ